jgi:hypothetical protein
MPVISYSDNGLAEMIVQLGHDLPAHHVNGREQQLQLVAVQRAEVGETTKTTVSASLIRLPRRRFQSLPPEMPWRSMRHIERRIGRQSPGPHDCTK